MAGSRPFLLSTRASPVADRAVRRGEHTVPARGLEARRGSARQRPEWAAGVLLGEGRFASFPRRAAPEITALCRGEGTARPASWPKSPDPALPRAHKCHLRTGAPCRMRLS